MKRDVDLRERFASLRRLEEAETPSFEAIRRRSRRRAARTLRSWAAAAAAAASVAGVFVVLLPSPDHRPQVVTRSAPVLAEWRSPTDFLLETPGRDLLRTIPEFGVYPAPELIPHSPTPTIAPAHAGQRHS